MTQDDLLLAATLCPGLSGERLLPRLLRDEAGPPGWRSFVESGAALEAVSREKATLAALGASVVTPRDADWPAPLPKLGVLRVLGRLPAEAAVAVVGSRQADRYGREIARRVGRAAAEAGLILVSGGALGTDAAAHEGCLEAGGRTVVVLGSGLSHPAPSSNSRLFERAAASGAVISPFPCHVPPSRHSFPKRNAWIAGLAAVTVVLQAGEGSGALHTARAASALGRPLYALPGPIDSPLHTGAHALLAAGAKVLTRPEAFLDEASLSSAGVDNSNAARRMAALAPSAVETGPSFGQALWRVAGAEPVPLASLAEEAGLPAGEAAALALQLELAGWLRASAGGRFARARPSH